MTSFRKILSLTLIFAFISLALADDQHLCCMKGLKSMKNVVICPAPCCPGYHEEEADPPGLAPVVWCKRDVVTKFLCCMRGWKTLGSVDICPAPCCPGYIELHANPPHLSPLIYCEKESKILSTIRSKHFR